MSQVMLVVGTRPEGIKMMPLYFALQKAGHQPYLCSTTQHDQLLTEVFQQFEVIPDCELKVMQKGQDLFHVHTAVLERMKLVYEKVEPACVLVQGDTTTVMAAAMAAFYQKIPVAHIEAGLRTGDKHHPFPEEVNREILGLVADYHFAPTALAVGNLLAEGKKRESVFYVGNTVVDALRIMREKIDTGAIKIRADIEQAVAGCILSKQKIVLVTMHRRESFNGPLESVLNAIKSIAQKHPKLFFFYPVHPNPQILKIIEKVGLDQLENMYLTESVAYKDLVYLLTRADCVATDSGGIQEEAVSLGKPVLVLREKTERMEGVWAGVAQLVGTEYNAVLQAFEMFLQQSSAAQSETFLYGDGYAAQKIVKILEMCQVLQSPSVSHFFTQRRTSTLS